MDLTPAQQEALNWITEGWCPQCHTQFKYDRQGNGDLYCDRGWTAAMARSHYALPTVMRLERKR